MCLLKVSCLDEVRESSAFLMEICSQMTAEEPYPSIESSTSDSAVSKAIDWESAEHNKRIERLREEEQDLTSTAFSSCESFFSLFV